ELHTLKYVFYTPDPVVPGKLDTFNVSGTLYTDITEITILVFSFTNLKLNEAQAISMLKTFVLELVAVIKTNGDRFKVTQWRQYPPN
ncbi:3792_t:CDS:2, partial [Funneliformis mosseae]